MPRIRLWGALLKALPPLCKALWARKAATHLGLLVLSPPAHDARATPHYEPPSNLLIPIPPPSNPTYANQPRQAPFCENFEFRLEAAGRTWSRSHAQDNLMDIVPLGKSRSNFNFSLEDKRVLVRNGRWGSRAGVGGLRGATAFGTSARIWSNRTTRACHLILLAP